jgi:hypothetical protein
MDVEFDGARQLIIFDNSKYFICPIDVLYKKWIIWASSGANVKFSSAMQRISLGVNNIAFFIKNGWDIIPKNPNNKFKLVGNYYLDKQYMYKAIK